MAVNRPAVTAQQLADESGATLDRATRVLPVAARTVNDYLKGGACPAELVNEAVLRYGSYLLSSDVGTIRSETLGPQAVQHVVDHQRAFINSGAQMLVARYRVRRAGAFG